MQRLTKYYSGTINCESDEILTTIPRFTCVPYSTLNTFTKIQSFTCNFKLLHHLIVIIIFLSTHVNRVLYKIFILKVFNLIWPNAILEYSIHHFIAYTIYECTSMSSLISCSYLTLY